MKKRGILALGIAIGMISSIGIQSFAGDAIQRVTASIDKTFQLTVNDEKKVLPEGYEMLVYQDRTYLPIRALGEMLGCEIDWDNALKTVKIVTPKNDPKPSDTDEGNYKKLPQTYESKDYRISILSYSSKLGEDKLSRLYFRLCATGDDTIRVNPSGIAFSSNGFSYHNYSSDVNMSDQDRKLYSAYAEEDNDLEGYLTLPEKIKDAQKIHVEIPVVKDTYRGQVTDIITFDIDVRA